MNYEKLLSKWEAGKEIGCQGYRDAYCEWRETPDGTQVKAVYTFGTDGPESLQIVGSQEVYYPEEDNG